MAWSVVYYETAQGDRPIEAFLDALSREARAKCLAYISRLEIDGTRLPASIAARFVILHAIQKKRQKLRERDIALAEQRYEEIKQRSHDENA